MTLRQKTGVSDSNVVYYICTYIDLPEHIEGKMASYRLVHQNDFHEIDLSKTTPLGVEICPVRARRSYITARNHLKEDAQSGGLS